MARTTALRAADEVWIATAMLHKGNPEREDFTREEILNKVLDEFGATHSLNTISTHISRHCVANKEPDPQAHRMLYCTERNGYRLFREGDDYKPAREKGEIMPDKQALPEKYHSLLTWFAEQYSPQIKVFGPEALARWLSIKPVRTGFTDVSVNHDKYLAQAVWEEFHDSPSNQTH